MKRVSLPILLLYTALVYGELKTYKHGDPGSLPPGRDIAESTASIAAKLASQVLINRPPWDHLRDQTPLEAYQALERYLADNRGLYCSEEGLVSPYTAKKHSVQAFIEEMHTKVGPDLFTNIDSLSAGEMASVQAPGFNRALLERVAYQYPASAVSIKALQKLVARHRDVGNFEISNVYLAHLSWACKLRTDLKCKPTQSFQSPTTLVVGEPEKGAMDPGKLVKYRLDQPGPRASQQDLEEWLQASLFGMDIFPEIESEHECDAMEMVASPPDLEPSVKARHLGMLSAGLLAKALVSGDDGEKPTAARRLLELATHPAQKAGNRRAVDALHWALTSSDSERVKELAVATLLRAGDPRASEILKDERAVAGFKSILLKSIQYDPAMREKAARGLGNIGGPTAVKALIAALQSDPHGDVRATAAAVLGQTHDPRAAGALRKALESELDPKVKATLQQVLDGPKSKGKG